MSERGQGARAWLDAVLDPGWTPIATRSPAVDPLGFPGYSPADGTDVVLLAFGSAGGHPVVAAAFDFDTFGGSMGVVAGARIAEAFARAAAAEVPCIIGTASGGARMQEGMHALATMPATLLARRDLARAGVPLICVLRNPTTGGVFASFVQSADLVWAEPGATIGFAGPRVVEAVTGALPDGASHSAESARDAGLIDAILPTHGVRTALTVVAGMLAEHRRPPFDPPPPPTTGARADIALARHPDRPVASYLAGDMASIRRGAPPDPSIVTGIAMYTYRPAVVIAHDRSAGRPRPAGFARARHAIALAERLRLPIVTLIDTPGADPSPASENLGIAREISATFEALLSATVPTVSIITGEGGSGGALALACTDHVWFLQNAFFSVIAPEAAATILRRDDATQVARDLRLDEWLFPRAPGEPTRVIIEEPPAHVDPEAARARVYAAISHSLSVLTGPTPERLTRWST